MRTTIIVTSLVLLSLKSWGQIRFGLYGELLRSQNIVKETGAPFEEVSSKKTFGFGVGTCLFFPDSNPVSFRLSFGLGFINEVVEFENPGKEELTRGSVFTEIPAHALFKFKKTSRFAVVTGMTPSLGLVGGKDQANNLNIKSFNLTADIGFNYSIQTKSIWIKPELRYSYSLINGVTDEPGLYTESIDKYLRNRFTLMIVFSKQW